MRARTPPAWAGAAAASPRRPFGPQDDTPRCGVGVRASRAIVCLDGPTGFDPAGAYNPPAPATMTVRTICEHAITLSITLNLLPLLKLEIKAQPKIEKPAPNRRRRAA